MFVRFKENRTEIYVLSVFLYTNGCGNISSKTKERHQARESWFKRKMLRNLWTKHLCKVDVLGKIEQISHI